MIAGLPLTCADFLGQERAVFAKKSGSLAWFSLTDRMGDGTTVAFLRKLRARGAGAAWRGRTVRLPIVRRTCG
jgi:hypothetical protein